MEHEDAYLLMMDALDGELDPRGQRRLQSHLHGCPLCAREWQTLQAIEGLLRQAPMLRPAAGFTQRTLARLPQRRHRVWLLTAFYGLLLFSGFAPLAAVVWLVRWLIPVLSEPALLRSLAQAAGHLFQLGRILLVTVWQILEQSGALLLQQPGILGGLLLMVGVVFLWSSVYSQLVSARRI